MSRSFALLAALVASSPLSALAAEECPDGWFCDQAPPPAEPAPPSDVPPPPTEPLTEPPPPPAEMDLEGQGDLAWEPPADPRSRHRARRGRGRREWGLNLHLSEALVGHDSRYPHGSGMEGFGVGLRYRVVPHFAIDSSVEWVTGRDRRGDERDETALLFNGLLFFNPRDPVQVYTFGGFGFGTAELRLPRGLDPNRYPDGGGDRRYWYFGIQGGLGMDIHLSRNVAVTTDILGLVRGRIDDDANRSPEFVDPTTHRATNTSGGGLFRLGATFYW